MPYAQTIIYFIYNVIHWGKKRGGEKYMPDVAVGQRNPLVIVNTRKRWIRNSLTNQCETRLVHFLRFVFTLKNWLVCRTLLSTLNATSCNLIILWHTIYTRHKNRCQGKIILFWNMRNFVVIGEKTRYGSGRL